MTALAKTQLPEEAHGPAESLLICGEYAIAGAPVPVRDPEDNSIVGLVTQADENDAARAVAFAHRERFVSANLPAHRRAEILERAAALVASRTEDLAWIIAREGIKTIREARFEVTRAAMTLKLSAEAAKRLTGETLRFDQRPGSEHRTGYFTREPVGVVLAITPFNDPLNLVAHKIGPAIAAGNTVILKPHQQTPLTALKLAEILLQAGLPPQILQVLPGSGDQLGPILLADDRVRCVSFTGGLETGRRIAAAAGLKRLEMELGSNCPTLVLEDADLDSAAEAIVSGAFWAAGQNCLHVQRVIAEKAIAAPLRDRIVALAENVQTGPKRNEATDMGCVVSEFAATRIADSLVDAFNRGARLLIGGRHHGTLFEPTLIENVPSDHALARDEVYGPVTVLSEAVDLDDAIQQANATPFGLQAGVFTRDLDRAHRAVRDIEAGAVMINESSDYRMDAMPFEGVKLSGLGREGVDATIHAMTEPKVACFTHRLPRS
ncbi:MAG: aldehyde dehydrogenase [Methylobacterium sp.]|nr:MAG: aldehyde dehydrogenase [Methylobacterium sp.]